MYYIIHIISYISITHQFHCSFFFFPLRIPIESMRLKTLLVEAEECKLWSHFEGCRPVERLGAINTVYNRGMQFSSVVACLNIILRKSQTSRGSRLADQIQKVKRSLADKDVVSLVPKHLLVELDILGSARPSKSA